MPALEKKQPESQAVQVAVPPSGHSHLQTGSRKKDRNSARFWTAKSLHFSNRDEDAETGQKQGERERRNSKDRERERLACVSTFRPPAQKRQGRCAQNSSAPTLPCQNVPSCPRRPASLQQYISNSLLGSLPETVSVQRIVL